MAPKKPFSPLVGEKEDDRGGAPALKLPLDDGQHAHHSTLYAIRTAGARGSRTVLSWHVRRGALLSSQTTRNCSGWMGELDLSSCQDLCESRSARS